MQNSILEALACVALLELSHFAFIARKFHSRQFLKFNIYHLKYQKLNT